MGIPVVALNTNFSNSCCFINHYVKLFFDRSFHNMELLQFYLWHISSDLLFKLHSACYTLTQHIQKSSVVRHNSFSTYIMKHKIFRQIFSVIVVGICYLLFCTGFEDFQNKFIRYKMVTFLNNVITKIACKSHTSIFNIFTRSFQKINLLSWKIFVCIYRCMDLLLFFK